MPDDKKRAGSLRRAFLFAIAVHDQKLILVASCMRRAARNELTCPNVVTVLLAEANPPDSPRPLLRDDNGSP